MIDISNTLAEYLKSFSGAKEDGKNLREDSLLPSFQQIAGKLLNGGHFVVADENDEVMRRVFLHEVEFYYHEEFDGGVKDYIVYHRNPEDPNKCPKTLPAFPIGSLHTHVSGVDITFEDNQDPNNPRYRASVLVRSFRVEEEKKIPGLCFSKAVDGRPTYFYNALFMGTDVIGGKAKVFWQNNNVKQCDEPKCKPRHNVGKFEVKTHKTGYEYHVKKKPFEQDERLWAFYL